MRVLLIIIASLCLVSSEDDEGGYSFQEFRGPVSGEVEEVAVPHHSNEQYLTVDYVAKPDYFFHHGVEDPVTGNHQVHQESRDGDKVLGEYRVLQPDGYLRIVKYTADGENGFSATVKYIKV